VLRTFRDYEHRSSKCQRYDLRVVRPETSVQRFAKV
jgi:hypothetical protein